MKKIYYLFLTLILSLCLLSSCKKMKDEKVGVAYGVVYKNYVARVEVEVTDGKVTDIDIDEALMPSEWAVTNYDKDHDYVIDHNDKRYIKNIKIGDITLVGGVKDDKLQWSNDKITSFDEYLKQGENAKWYFEALKNKMVSIVDDTNNVIKDLTFSTTNMFKSVANYWPKTDTSLGWKENIKELIRGMEETNLTIEPKYGPNNKVVFDSTITQATLVGHKEYYALAKKALENAK